MERHDYDTVNECDLYCDKIGKSVCPYRDYPRHCAKLKYKDMNCRCSKIKLLSKNNREGSDG